MNELERLKAELERVQKQATAMRHTLERLRNKLRKAPSAYSFPGVTSDFICEIERDVVKALDL